MADNIRRPSYAIHQQSISDQMEAQSASEYPFISPAVKPKIQLLFARGSAGNKGRGPMIFRPTSTLDFSSPGERKFVPYLDDDTGLDVETRLGLRVWRAILLSRPARPAGSGVLA